MPQPNCSLAREALYEIIENQIRDLAPQETKQTYDRLCSDGYSPEETMNLISCVLTSELTDMLNEQRTFDEGRYAAALRTLPKLPWDDNDRIY